MKIFEAPNSNLAEDSVERELAVQQFSDAHVIPIGTDMFRRQLSHLQQGALMIPSVLFIGCPHRPPLNTVLPCISSLEQ